MNNLDSGARERSLDRHRGGRHADPGWSELKTSSVLAGALEDLNHIWRRHRISLLRTDVVSEGCQVTQQVCDLAGERPDNTIMQIEWIDPQSRCQTCQLEVLGTTLAVEPIADLVRFHPGLHC